MKKVMALIALLALTVFAAPVFAAENPFTDVPAGHWAYDAVAQLASRGIASGYPDGAYKGSQPMTRYEMASMVGRALAGVDMEKASKQDLELLKKLVMEFKNELDALGVKVSDLDKRVAVLEDGVGGWKIRGIFQFDANFSDSDGGLYQYSDGKKNEFKKERLRFFLTKTLDENTFFYAQYRTGSSGGVSGRGDMEGGKWTDVYVDTKFANDIGLRIGRFAVDFEGDYGLYTDNDALFGDFSLDGFRLTKSFGSLNATAVVGRNFSGVGHEAGVVAGYTEDHMAYILDLNYRPNEKFMIGATGYWGHEDNDTTGLDSNTYTLYASYGFTPSIALKGMYYWQDNDVPAGFSSFDDSPNAWKVALDVKQDALKFTSLWVEYSQTDNTFLSGAFPRYSVGSTDASVTANRPFNDETTKVWFVKAAQRWNDKWDSWLRFAHADFNTAGIDDATEWGVGIGYQYTPAIHFELAYDQVDYGTGTQTFQDKENVFRFRTTVNF